MNDTIEYKKLMHTAICSVIKNALATVAQLSNHHNIHIAISFLTNYKGVVLPDHVKNNYPREITIILQHQFRNLQVSNNSASVVLSFQGKEETVIIPYCSIIKYIDVHQGFALDLEQYISNNTKELEGCSNDIDHINEESNKKSSQDNIIFIDAFLKK